MLNGFFFFFHFYQLLGSDVVNIKAANQTVSPTYLHSLHLHSGKDLCDVPLCEFHFGPDNY